MHEASTFFSPLCPYPAYIFSSFLRRQEDKVRAKEEKINFSSRCQTVTRLSYDVDDLLLRGFHLE